MPRLAPYLALNYPKFRSEFLDPAQVDLRPNCLNEAVQTLDVEGGDSLKKHKEDEEADSLGMDTQ